MRGEGVEFSNQQIDSVHCDFSQVSAPDKDCFFHLISQGNGLTY